MKYDVLEIEIIKINKEYSVWYITRQYDFILERGIFIDDDLQVYSKSTPAYIASQDTLWVGGNEKTQDLCPKVIRNKYVEQLKRKVHDLNKKYENETLWYVK